jgi:hypothetical protein
MVDVWDLLWKWVNDEAVRTVVLFVTASTLGLASLLLFFSSAGSSPTRFHLGLMICSVAIVFYLTIRATPT